MSPFRAAVTKIPHTGWFRNNRHLVGTGLETEKSKIVALADLVCREDPLVGWQPHMLEEVS